MKPRQRRQVMEIFEEARSRPPGERVTFLEKACENDPRLRLQVESLLEQIEDFQLLSQWFVSHKSAPEVSERSEAKGGLFRCSSCAALTEAQAAGGGTSVPSRCPLCGASLLAMVGSELDGYRIEELLGSGGFGVVYLASNLAEPSMRAVVKVLRPKWVHGRSELVKTFVEEARLTEEIGQTCWNVVRVFNVREKPWPYFFMEYLRGTTLSETIRNAGDTRVAIPTAKGYLRGIAKALVATHAKGRVHRDLKPDNLMVLESDDVAPEQSIKLLDFGLAISSAERASPDDSSEDRGKTRETGGGESPLLYAGTPEYMAPEAFDQAAELSGDIYAFGVTAYELLTGKRPWDKPPPKENRLLYWQEAHRHRAPRPIREDRPDVPARLSRTVMRCLEKEAGNRPRDAEEILAELREPLPVTAKLALAAVATLLVVLLAYSGFATLRDPLYEGLRWSRRDGSTEFELEQATVWVRNARDLATCEIIGKPVEKKRLLQCESSDPERVRCAVSPDGGLVLRFADIPSLDQLIGETIEVFGRGDGFRLQASVRVRRDDQEPVFVGSVRVSNGPGVLRELSEETRALGKQVSLVVTIDEANPRRVFFRHAHGGLASMTDTPFTSTDPSTYALSLGDLGRAGPYRGNVIGEDQAGNRALQAVSFVLDDGVQLSPPEVRYLTANRAYYELRLQEKITAFEVKLPATGEVVEWQIARPQEPVTGALDLARQSGRLQPLVGEFTEGVKYLLSVPLGDGDEIPSFALYATDAAFPANRSSRIDLPPVSYQPLEFEHLRELSLWLDDAPDAVRALRQDEFHGFVLARPTRSLRLRGIELDVAPESVHRAECSIDSVPREATTVEPQVVRFDDLDLDLQPNRANELQLSLYDGRNRRLASLLKVVTDRRPPEIDLRVSSNGLQAPVYHDVRNWREVEFSVASSEPLEAVSLNVDTLQVLGESVTERGDAWRFLLPEKRDCVDGEYPVLVKARDLAGNPASPLEPLPKVVINNRGPRITLSEDALADGRLQLSSDDVSLTLSDGNGVELEKAKATFVVLDPPGTAPVTERVRAATESTEDSGLCTISLATLPPACSGRLTIEASDAFGVVSSWSEPFVFRRPRPKWPKKLVARSIAFRLISTEAGDLYCARGEISNAVYAELLGSESGPPLWSRSGRFPYCLGSDGSNIRGDDYPVVEITPKQAEAFAAAFGFGARLPTRDEWLVAAWLENPGGSYPWKDVPEGKDCCNYYRFWDERPRSPFLEPATQQGWADDRRWRSGDGKREFRWRVVSVSFDPVPALPSATTRKLHYRGEFLHLMGNVRELVRLENDRYGVAGGDFTDDYSNLSLRGDPEPYSSPDVYTGFRIVVPASRSFVEASRNRE